MAKKKTTPKAEQAVVEQVKEVAVAKQYKCRECGNVGESKQCKRCGSHLTVEQ